MWNSFVMVGSAWGLMELIKSTTPVLYHSFAGLLPVFDSPAMMSAFGELYDRIDEVNFFHRVLRLRAERLAVVKVSGVRWNDLGKPKRVFASLDLTGLRRTGWTRVLRSLRRAVPLIFSSRIFPRVSGI